MTDTSRPDRQRGFLGFIERAGNLLPDPTIIFVYLIFALMLLSALGAALGSIPHFGGSAGDDNHLTRTHVYYGGRFHAHAAVVVMVNTWLDFEVFTTHHLQPRQEKLIVTAADSARRTVIELNAEPAAVDVGASTVVADTVAAVREARSRDAGASCSSSGACAANCCCPMPMRMWKRWKR